MRSTPDSQRQDVAIVGGNKYGRYQKISSEQTFNMFISDNWLINTAGFQRFYEILPPGAEGRGMFPSIRGNILIIVAGPNVYSFNMAMSPTLIGTLATETGEVTIDENLNSQICIVDGTNAYIYNYSLGSPNLTTQTLIAGLTPGFVSFHDTYFLFGNNDRTPIGSKWYVYQYNTDTTITIATPGEFALQTKPDYALAIVRLPSQAANVLVMGTSVCEIWTHIGGLQNYRKNNTLSVDYGCTSTSTIVTNDTYVVWLAENENNAPIIMVYTGQGFEPVSTDGIDYQLSKIQFPAQSTAMFYRQDGHLFYQLTFFNPVDNMTILYDLDTKMFFTLTDEYLNYHQAREYAYFNNNMYFISLRNASLYLSSTDFDTYNENIPESVYNQEIDYDIPRIRITDTIRSTDSSQFRVNTFSFTIEQGCDPNVTGVSLVPPDEFTIPYQPRVDLTISRDGGITWSNTVSRNLHPLGYRQNILNWDRMGSCNSFTAKIKFFSTARVLAYNGFVEMC